MSEMVPFPGDGEVPTYPKIYSPFKRATEGPHKNKLREGDWYDSAFATLQDATWRWTEKLDGMNIRIHWNGVRVSMAGRTDRAQLPMDLVTFVQENLPEELFEQKFQGTPVTLFGEGIGAGIQKGGNYSPTKKFVLFDVRIGNVWQQDEMVTETADAFGIERAKLWGKTDVWEAIRAVENGLVSAYSTPENTTFCAEGLVGVPVDGFLDFRGRRIAMKIKTCDFFEKGVIRE